VGPSTLFVPVWALATPWARPDPLNSAIVAPSESTLRRALAGVNFPHVAQVFRVTRYVGNPFITKPLTTVKQSMGQCHEVGLGNLASMW
jgi:hypothetical protein